MAVPRMLHGASEARELGGWLSFEDAAVLDVLGHREGESVSASSSASRHTRGWSSC